MSLINTASSLAEHYAALASCVEKRPKEADEAEQERVQRIGQLYRLTADVLRYQAADRARLLALALVSSMIALLNGLWWLFERIAGHAF